MLVVARETPGFPAQAACQGRHPRAHRTERGRPPGVLQRLASPAMEGRPSNKQNKHAACSRCHHESMTQRPPHRGTGMKSEQRTARHASCSRSLPTAEDAGAPGAQSGHRAREALGLTRPRRGPGSWGDPGGGPDADADGAHGPGAATELCARPQGFRQRGGCSRWIWSLSLDSDPLFITTSPVSKSRLTFSAVRCSPG